MSYFKKDHDNDIDDDDDEEEEEDGDDGVLFLCVLFLIVWSNASLFSMSVWT